MLSNKFIELPYSILLTPMMALPGEAILSHRNMLVHIQTNKYAWIIISM